MAVTELAPDATDMSPNVCVYNDSDEHDEKAPAVSEAIAESTSKFQTSVLALRDGYPLKGRKQAPGYLLLPDTYI